MTGNQVRLFLTERKLSAPMSVGPWDAKPGLHFG